jgi:alpha-1,3-glucan synthase
VYSFLLALGQIIASNSYQLTLLTGEVGQSAEKLYIIAGVYLASSLVWGFLSRHVKLLYILTTPWALYGIAFLMIGASPFISDLKHRFWMQNVATSVYSAASASGAIFFSYNFGDEGKKSTPVLFS